MPASIFYSWQSDLPNSVCRRFLGDALDKAIKAIAADASILEALREDSLAVDMDTQGVPGSPAIADTIFEKISGCAAFVPDLTFVAKSEGGRQIPNPNVLIEYGWALKVCGNSRIVPVMNAAFGAPSWDSLPFDMRHLRHPVTYNVAADSDAADRKKEKDQLVKALTKALSSVLTSGKPTDEPSTMAFGRWPTGENAAVFEGINTALTTGDGSVSQDLKLPNDSYAFLRVFPANAVEPLESSRVAYDLAQKGLHPMRSGLMGMSWSRNKNGALAFTRDDNNVVFCLSQLFKTKEVWGIDGYTLAKEIHKKHASVSFGYFPFNAFENTFVSTLTNYLAFAKTHLALKPPLVFIAGVHGVDGFRLTAPDGMYFGSGGSFGGLCVEDSISYEGSVDSYDANPHQLLLPFFKRVWEDCGLERPPLPKDSA